MHVMIIGALDGQIGAASKIAVSRGAKVTLCDTVEQSLKALRAGQGADLVMIDVVQDVAALTASLDGERINVPVIACGVGNDTQAAVRAIKAGAKEYIPLPPNAELIAAVLTAVAEETHAIIFKDPLMGEVLNLAKRVAGSDAGIMITGPSGTGKELMARYIHEESPRTNKRFVAVNCAAIPENLLESELFGYEKGAFTGAVGRRIGKFEEATGGTLLLDEISEMDPRLQAKLLRAVQEQEIDRIGGSKPIKVNVRIVATSNRNMEEEISKGAFREDLYFRLNVVNLKLPALCERPLDIPVLADHFIKVYAKANKTKPLPLSAETLRTLINHPWPGNVRELENTIHRAILLAVGDEIELGDIMLTVQGGGGAGRGDEEGTASTTGLVGRTVSDVERGLIIDTLSHCLGNRTHAANILGISIRTLRNKLKIYMEQGFSVPTPGETERPAL